MSFIEKDIICFCHLRWDFVFQRPQQLMTRLARTHRIFLVEEPLYEERKRPATQRWVSENICIVTPVFRHGISAADQEHALAGAMASLQAEHEIIRPILWYYTPLMMSFSKEIDASLVVYDCMDELTGFRFASSDLERMENALLARADLVFAGGKSLFDAKSKRHHAVHLFPSSVDTHHFSRARDAAIASPQDQQSIPGPKLGFFGVIDERMDVNLLRKAAALKPEWNFVLVGPIVKLSEEEVPRARNIHYLGPKPYAELPNYLAGWDVALMPFALNEATRFISPTKTPEYLAGGKPIVSTPILDVMDSYGDINGVFIATDPQEFVDACTDALELGLQPGWTDEADALLARTSWDSTVAAMEALLRGVPASPAVAGSNPHFDYLVVGAGFAGAVMAERLARDAGQKVMVIDRRPHIGGNAYDHLDAAGIRIHKYGPHIFHTNSQSVFDYLSRFTRWRPYEHKVLARVDQQLVPMPINRTTLNLIYGMSLQTDADAAHFLAKQAIPMKDIRTAEDMVVSAVGPDLYNRFFQGYSRKQWGVDPSQLDKSVTARVPARTNTDDRYFTDAFQFMPLDGYTRLFENILDHGNITISLNTDFKEVDITYRKAIYCGPIDEYFGHQLGKLPYRSLRFEHRTLAVERFQPAAVVNYPDGGIEYTRITEYKYLTGQSHPQTSVSYEYPTDEGDPYYPVPAESNEQLRRAYERLAAEEPDVLFCGRLGTYRYYNMDQVVAQSLSLYRKMGISRSAGRDVALPVLASEA